MFLNKLTDFLSNCWFVICVCWIIFDELCLYYAFKNYEKCIRNLTYRLSLKNILYVKIFQALVLNNNIIDQQYADCLLKFTDNVPWSSKDIDKDALVSLEKEYNITILNDYMPINSGMISLVFKGLKEGGSKPIIIKMKRNNIDTTLQDGIQKLLFCARLMSFIPIIEKASISDIIHNNIHLIKQQTNFTREVENIKMMKNNSKHLKYIKIPNVYEDVTDKFSNIIMMEYIKGETISSINPADYIEYSKQIIKFVLVSMLMTGRCHGDLHIGNILFIKDENDTKYKYKIGVLDFGLVYEIDKMKNTFYYIFANMTRTSAEVMAQKLLLSGLIEPVDCLALLPKKHANNIMLILTKFIDNTFNISKHFSQINIFNSISELNDYIVDNNLMVNGFDIRPCEDLVKFQVIFSMLYGVIFKLCGDNYIEIINKAMIELFHIEVSES